MRLPLRRRPLELFIGLCLLAALLLLFLDSQTRLWSLGALALASLYPFTKRVTQLPQLFLGLAFAWSIPMAYVAEAGMVDRSTWILFTAVVVWVLIYDTFYAMVDRSDDLRVGIKSTAILFGRFDRLITGLLQVLFIALLLVVGIHKELNGFFYGSLSITGALFIYQQWLIRSREPKLCFSAFLNNNYVGVAIFMGIAIDQLL